MSLRVHIDRGGTFTDVVRVGGGDDPRAELAVAAAIRASSVMASRSATP